MTHIWSIDSVAFNSGVVVPGEVSLLLITLVAGRQGLQGLHCWPKKYQNYGNYILSMYIYKIIPNGLSMSISFYCVSDGYVASR